MRGTLQEVEDSVGLDELVSEAPKGYEAYVLAYGSAENGTPFTISGSEAVS
jgi:hypothetical protein